MNSGKSFGRVVASVVLVAVLCASCVTTVPMTDGEPVDVEKVFMGSEYYQDEELLSHPSMVEVLDGYDETDRYMSQYRLRRIGYTVFSTAGMLLMIGGVATSFSEAYLTSASLFLGASVMYGVALPFSIGSMRSLDKAVDVYNTDVVEVE